MPDRDEFAHLPRGLRAAARAYLSAAQGTPFSSEAVAEGLDELFNGGVASLPAQLACWEALRPHPEQQAFVGPSFRRQELEAIDEVAREHATNQLDELLALALQRSLLADESNIEVALQSFVVSVVENKIVQSKRGVVAQAPDADLDKARTAIAPLVAEAAAQLLSRPDLKRLGLATDHRRPLDLHADNLLAGDL